MNQTVFKDVRQRAKLVYRVMTRSSEYLIGIHEVDGRRFAIVRGMPGTERANAISRDSDPRVGGHSMFELPLSEWPGKMLEVATMTTSPIVSAIVETDPRAIAAVAIDTLPGSSPASGVPNVIVDPQLQKAPQPRSSHQQPPKPQHDQQRSPWARPVSRPESPPPPSPERAAGHAPLPANPAMPAQQAVPPGGSHSGKAWSAPKPVGMPENPRIVPVPVKGTHPAMLAAELAAKWNTPQGAPTEVDMPAQAPGAHQPPQQHPQHPQHPPQVVAGPNSYAQQAVAHVSPIVQQVVLGQQAGAPPGPAEPQLPYPQRHVGYAESAAALLRSIAKRDRLFEDISRDRELKERLRRALDDCATLLEQIRRRDRA